MAQFFALLLIGPWLLVLGGLYWLFARRRVAHGVSARLDAALLALAMLAAIAGSVIGYQWAVGHASPIWKQIAAPIGAYAGFSLVLGGGLLWHSRRRRGA